MRNVATHQLAAQGPAAYERYLVPAFFAECARQLLDLAAPQPSDQVLDVACGTGVIARAAEPLAAAVTGIDLDEDMLAVARSKSSGVRWLHGDATRLDLPAHSFDLVTCQQGLQFLPDRAAAVREWRRVLKPGGRIAVAMWRDARFHPQFAALSRAFEDHLGPEAGAALRAPFAGPQPTELRALFADAGFASVRLRIGLVPVRFGSVAEMAEHEASATPAAPAFAAAAEETRITIVGELAAELADWVDDDGLTFPLVTWLVNVS
ncbi:class I SAM-dependent methyltransferase [Amycolatopsis thermoflava]|uniref:Ubiquinone/menaquinone biosynthesis C-methylase UbiE n=1 Tax=Amycolatopsis thermoflava TaxID=84480 RepID=A0A3N2H2L9_9PSEU|nr:methyltransferase domain-containing protein [Amycolatopsis thermoflava]ROS43124.1 ubiquinone/menaquinone biosynthesis C-methylase UbiE [Amycolatopsis thermoflava]